MKKSHVLLVCCAFINVLNAQKQSFKQNYIYTEALGNGFLYSFNYERQFSKKPGLGIRLGMGQLSKQQNITIPVGLNYLYKIKKKEFVYLDIGFGVTYSKAEGYFIVVIDHKPGYKHTQLFNFVPSIGARVLKKNKLMYRCSFTPVIGQNGFMPWFGFSFGKGF